MQFLKTLFWVALAVVLVLFASANWHLVTIRLWGGLQADVKLPVLILAVFLLGFVPTWLFYRARLWSMNRRLEAMDRQLDAIRASVPAPAPAQAPGPATGLEASEPAPSDGPAPEFAEPRSTPDDPDRGEPGFSSDRSLHPS
jgi:uncharacterized integral membrane protein